MDEYATSTLTILVCPTIPALIILGGCCAIAIDAIRQKRHPIDIVTPVLGILSTAAAQFVVIYLAWEQLTRGPEYFESLSLLFAVLTSVMYFLSMCMLATLIAEVGSQSGLGRAGLAFFGVLVISAVLLFNRLGAIADEQSQWVDMALSDGTAMSCKRQWLKFLGFSIPFAVMLLTLAILQTAYDEQGRAVCLAMLACGFTSMAIFAARIFTHLAVTDSIDAAAMFMAESGPFEVLKHQRGNFVMLFPIIAAVIYAILILPSRVALAATRTWQGKNFKHSKVGDKEMNFEQTNLLGSRCREYGGISV